METENGKAESVLELPLDVPVMVLGTVLFPDAVMPLRIFEPRYREMLEWALEHDRMFCVATMKPGVAEAEKEGQFFHTAGLGLVAASVTQEDGTSNLILKGLARVRFTGFPQRRPFRIAEIERLPDIEAEPEATAPLLEKLGLLCAKIRVAGKPLPKDFTEMLKDGRPAGFKSNAIATSLVADVVQRQRLLEERNPAERLRILIQILGGDVAQE